MLTVAAAVYAATGIAGAFDRELLGVFDALLVVVLCSPDAAAPRRDLRVRAMTEQPGASGLPG